MVNESVAVELSVAVTDIESEAEVVGVSLGVTLAVSVGDADEEPVDVSEEENV